MSGLLEEVVIVGITEAGYTFRPNDWADRLCGCMCAFGEDQRIVYSPYLKPVFTDGIKCVVINRALADVDPIAFSFLMSFARDNELQVREGRHGKRSETGNPVLKMKSPQL